MEQPLEQRNIEVTKPKEAQKATPEKSSQPSVKEKQALLSEHAKTKKRITDAEHKLQGVEALLKIFPIGELKKEAEKRYEQAKKILKKATEDFRAFVPEGVEEAVVQIVESIQKGNEIQFEKYKKLAAIGIPTETATTYIGYKCMRNTSPGIDAMIDYLTETTHLGVHHEDAFAIWSRLDSKSMDTATTPMEMIKKMQSLGIRDNFFAIHQLCRRLLGKITDYQYQEMAKKVESLHISRKDYIGFTDIQQEDMPRFEEISARVYQIKKAGFSDHFYDAWVIAGSGPSRGEVKDYKRIFELFPLRKFFDFQSMIVIANSMKGEPKNISSYIMAFLNDPILQDECKKSVYIVAEMYQVEKDPAKAMDHIRLLKESGISWRDIASVAVPLYQSTRGGEPSSTPEFRTSMEVVKHIISVAKKLDPKGTELRFEIILALTSRGDILSHKSDDDVVKDILQFKKEMSAVTDDQNSLAILRELSSGNALVAKYLFAKNKSITQRDGGSAIQFISMLRREGMMSDAELEEVLTCGYDIEKARHIAHFFRTFPTMKLKARTYSSTAGMEYSNDNLGDAVEAYYAQPAEIEAFVRHLLERQASVPYTNLKKFIDDPTLPLSISIYKALNNNDPEMALRIGRSLSAQGMTTIPDRVTLNAKIRAWKELQESVNNIKILEGRNVVVLNNGERWGEDGDGYKKGDLRFNSQDKKNGFAKSIGSSGTVDFFAPPSDKPTVEELQRVKNRTLEKVSTTPPPMTFFFSGHGAPDGLYMNNGKIVGDKPEGDDFERISDRELAGAIAKRTEKFSRDALSQDIYIYSSCFNANFIRRVYAEIKFLGGVAPISIGESEYGQYGHSDQEKFNIMYQLGVRGTTIEHLRKNEGKYLSSNFTVYVPNKEGIPQQISKASKEVGPA